MREKNPDMVAGKKQKFVMRPPQVVRIGTKKTSFANFTEVSFIIFVFFFYLSNCKSLHYYLCYDFLIVDMQNTS